MSNNAYLSNITVVLVRPRYPENIGAAARAMRNMGIEHLIVVDPRDADPARISKLATHAAADVIEKMAVFDDLKQALKPFQFVIGATARLGRQRPIIPSPSLMAKRLTPIAQNNRVALLFGPEDRGLENPDIRLCHWLVNIPTSDFHSLNLAQAVMIICYEIFKAGTATKDEHAPRLAERHELDGMYDQVKDIMVRIDYIKPANPDYWMNRMRRFFTRMQLQAKEVRIIRGICRQIDWYAKQCRQDGRDEKKSDRSI